MLRFFGGLRFRLMLLVLLALVPSWALIMYSASEQRRSAAVRAQEHALQIVRDASKTQQTLIDNTHEFLSVLSQLDAIHDLNPATCNEFLDQFIDHYPRYTSITMRAAKDAEPICRATPKNGAIPAEPGIAHVRALEANDFAVGDYLIGKTSGKGVLPFGYPIVDETGEIQAILMVALDLDVLSQLAAEALLPSGSTLMVIDSTGKVLVHYPDPGAWVGRSVADVPVVKAILAQKAEGAVEALGEDHVLRLYGFAPLTDAPSSNVYVSVGIPSAVAFTEVNDSLTKNLIALALVAALALGAAWFGGDWFVLRQVNGLVRLAERLGKGDLQARSGSQYSVGELGQLARAFDNMGESLEQQETARQLAEDQIRHWSAQLECLMNALSDAISQSYDVGRIADIALVRTLSMMGLTCGGVFLKRGESVTLISQTGLLDEIIARMREEHLGDTAWYEQVDAAQVQVVKPGSAEPSRQQQPAEPSPRSWIRVPLKSKGRVFGAMCIACEDDRPLRVHEKGVLAAVGQQIGVAIESAELHDQVQSIAALHERERLSRELHDGLAQVLGYLCIRAEVVRDHVKASRLDRAARELDEMQGVVQQAHQDLRESILGLRATIHPGGGLSSALKDYLHKFSVQTGIVVNLASNSNARIQFSPEAEVQLLRIIQEALANIRKHSGAKQAWIRFEHDTDPTTITIEDNGKGFDLAMFNQSGQPRFGLQTMRERAESVGGLLQVTSQPGQGVKITVSLPVRSGVK